MIVPCCEAKEASDSPLLVDVGGQPWCLPLPPNHQEMFPGSPSNLHACPLPPAQRPPVELNNVALCWLNVQLNFDFASLVAGFLTQAAGWIVHLKCKRQTFDNLPIRNKYIFRTRTCALIVTWLVPRPGESPNEFTVKAWEKAVTGNRCLRQDLNIHTDDKALQTSFTLLETRDFAYHARMLFAFFPTEFRAKERLLAVL